MIQRQHVVAWRRWGPSLVLLAGVVACGTATKDPVEVIVDAQAPSASPSPPASDTPQPAPPPDPCLLVTLNEAHTLAGTPLADGVLSGTGGDRSCTYTGLPDGPLAQVEVYVGDGALKFLDIEQSLGHDLVPVEGIGDEAQSEEFAVFARSGQTWFAIHLVRLDEPDAYREGLEDLARTVVSRL